MAIGIISAIVILVLIGLCAAVALNSRSGILSIGAIVMAILASY